MRLTSGYVSGSHMIICGSFSSGAMIADVGRSAGVCMASSVDVAEEMLSSV